MENGHDVCSEEIREFTCEDFFNPGEGVYIHMSSEFPKFVGVRHKHRFIEIVYIISGKATHVVGDHRYGVSKGDLSIVNYETPHAFFVDLNYAEIFDAYDLMFTPDFLDLSLIEDAGFEELASSFLFNSLFPEKQTIGPDLQLSGSSYNIFGDMFKKIYNEYKAKEKGYINIIRAYLIELVIIVFRRMNATARHAISYRHVRVINTALDYLRKNYNTHLTIKDLAARSFLSKDYFGRTFQEITGLSFRVMLRQIRVEHACKLLLSTDMNVLGIAEECGFSDIKSFYNCFKKTTGITPGRYRNKAFKLEAEENSPHADDLTALER